MDRKLAAALYVSITLAVSAAVSADAQQQVRKQQPDMKSAFTTADFSSLPAMPEGKSTSLGGQIRSLDPVLDQFTLQIVGDRPLKILFDERTQVYRNGERVPLRELHTGEHASVQTVLEGAKVFAISIHMLTNVPDGETEGHVLGYDPTTRELLLGSSLTRDPIRLFLREDTPVERKGQSAFTSQSTGQGDLVSGALIEVNFDADEKGRAIANHVTVLAMPGSNFAFSGKVISLDMHSGILVVLDPRDQKSYQISFDPARLPVTRTLHVGDQVRVTATYIGSRYTAIDLSPFQGAQP